MIGPAFSIKTLVDSRARDYGPSRGMFHVRKFDELLGRLC